MSLDVYLEQSVFTRNMTHNLAEMADHAGVYDCIWRPDENNIYEASELVTPLAKGLSLLLSDPEMFKRYNPENGWGSYDTLVRFVAEYLQGCINHPDARVRVSR
jgi:hypothetical protein